MKKCFLPILVIALSLLNVPVFSQTGKDTTALLGLPGDNLDLYAVLTLFQKSKTIEAFEKSLNAEKSKLNNLDLDLNKKIDFIKVVTKKNDQSYTFTLQVDVTKTEVQDVAIIYVDKDKNNKISIQMVGDPDLYGKDYVIEPKGNSSATSNPGYVGPDPVTKDVPATTTVVVQSVPIVQYVYSPAYVPYAPPYYYGYYPPYFAMATVLAVGIYRSNHWGYHGGYHGGHYGGGNTVIINNGNKVNHYNNNNRNTSNTVANNRNNGNYGSGSANRPAGGASGSTRPSGGGVGGASPSTRPSGGGAGGASPSTRPSNTGGLGGSSSRPTTTNSSMGSSRTRSSSGGGFSGGGGGMSRGGSGGGRRR